MLKFLRRVFSVKQVGEAPKVYSKPPMNGDDLDGYTLLLWIMWAKDPDLHNEFRTGLAGATIRKWKAKYPGDFTAIEGGTPAFELSRDPRRHIKLSSQS